MTKEEAEKVAADMRAAQKQLDRGRGGLRPGTLVAEARS
jgi:hypothetical protein